jgi:hypothetical protein
MSRLTFVTPLVLAALVVHESAHAEERPLLATLAGTKTEVYVTSIDAVERKGRITAVSDDGLRLTFGGRETFVPWEEVVTVDRRGDPIWDGAAKGAGIAAALYGAVALAAGANAGEVVQFAGTAALGWGAVGAIIDACNVGRSRVFVSSTNSNGLHVRPGMPPTRSFVVGGRLTF